MTTQWGLLMDCAADSEDCWWIQNLNSCHDHSIIKLRFPLWKRNFISAVYDRPLAFMSWEKADKMCLLNRSKTFISTFWCLAVQQNTLEALSQLMSNNAYFSKQIKPCPSLQTNVFNSHRHASVHMHTQRECEYTSQHSVCWSYSWVISHLLCQCP